MGLGRVIGWGVAFVFLAVIAVYAVVYAIAMLSVYVTPASIGGLGGAALWAVIAYFVGKKFMKALREYRASKASRVRKPLQ
jgi:hypothetical protein